MERRYDHSLAKAVLMDVELHTPDERAMAIARYYGKETEIAREMDSCEDHSTGNLLSLIKRHCDDSADTAIEVAVKTPSPKNSLLKYVTAPVRYPLYGMLPSSWQEKLAHRHGESALHYTTANLCAEITGGLYLLVQSTDQSGNLQMEYAIGSLALMCTSLFRSVGISPDAQRSMGSILSLPLAIGTNVWSAFREKHRELTTGTSGDHK